MPTIYNRTRLIGPVKVILVVNKYNSLITLDDMLDEAREQGRIGAQQQAEGGYVFS